MREEQPSASSAWSERLHGWFADDRRFWLGCTVLFAAFSILKGLRLPNLWAATQINVDYRFGFIKRGLFGAALRVAHVPIEHYDAIVLVSAVSFLLFIGLLSGWIVRSGVRRVGDGAYLALFGASYCLTFQANLLGYLDIPSASLAIIAIWLGDTSLYLVATIAAGVLGVLMHENYLLTFMPLTLMPAFLRVCDGRRLKRELASIAVVAAVVAGLVIFETYARPLNAAQVKELKDAIVDSIDFKPYRGFFSVLGRSAFENVVIMWNLMQTARWWGREAIAFLVFMPTSVLFLRMSHAVIDSQLQSQPARLCKVVVTLTALCPLTLQVFGWDIFRWYALTTLSSFIVLTLVCRHWRDSSQWYALSPAARNLIVLLIAVNLVTGTGLFAEDRVDTFPFVDHWLGMADWIASGHWVQPVR